LTGSFRPETFPGDFTAIQKCSNFSNEHDPASHLPIFLPPKTLDMPADKDPAEPAKNESPYTVRVWQTIAIVSLFITILLVVRVAFNVLLMALAGCLIAVYFHGLSDLIQRKTRITRRFAMLLSIGGTLVVIALSVWFIGSKIQIQVAELSNTLPGTIRITKTKLNSTPLGRKVLDYTSGQQPEKMLDTATAFFNTGFGVLGDLYIILFLGLFFTASPTLYKEGILLLVPNRERPRVFKSSSAKPSLPI
jgi:predicted PurR-regulated permease PerM